MKTIYLLALALFPCLVSCNSMGSEPDPEWRETEVEAATDSLVWKITLLSLQRKGFPLTGMLDRGDRKLVSGWKTHLQPFSGDGWRERISVDIEPVSRRLWRVRAHVQRQVNMALVSPLDPTRAEWEWAGENPIQAEILLQAIASTLNARPRQREESGVEGS